MLSVGNFGINADRRGQTADKGGFLGGSNHFPFEECGLVFKFDDN